MRSSTLAVVVTVILVAGLWPGTSPPINRIAFATTGQGLRLSPLSQAITATELIAEGGKWTLEVWFSQAAPSASGNREIAGLWTRAGEPALILGQWPGGLYLHSHDDNPAGYPQLDHYVRLTPEGSTRHLALVGNSKGIQLCLDGQAPRTVILPGATTSRRRFGGRLLLGASGRGSPTCSGVIRAVAFHRRSLSPAELRLRNLLPAERIIGSGTSQGLVALYRFEGHDPGKILKYPMTAPKILFPKRVSAPNPSMLSFALRPRWHGGSRFWDLAINLLGFVPLGLAIAWSRERGTLMTALAASIALSLAIEVAQFWLPGRDSSGIDFLCNSLGILIGWYFAGRIKTS